jgi:hypothetical protein
MSDLLIVCLVCVSHVLMTVGGCVDGGDECVDDCVDEWR